MKYICTEDADGKKEIFIFPRSVNHDAMAEVLMRIKNQTHGDWLRLTREPVSAGFVADDGTCFGKSETLNLSYGINDTKLLASQYIA